MRFPSHSFTTESNNGILKELKTVCGISLPFDPNLNNTEMPAVSGFLAIWDTGATGSVITPKVVNACNLQPISVTQVNGVNSTDIVNVYLVCIYLPNDVIVLVHATEGNLPNSDADILVGMDVISQGDFAVTNKNEITKFSFRIPSEVHIDFVAEHNKKTAKKTTSSSKNKTKARKKIPKKHGKNKNRKGR